MPAPRFTQVRRTTLKVSIDATESGEIVLNELLDIGGVALDMSDFGTDLTLTFEPGGESEEIIAATDFEVNDDGSVSINTGIARGRLPKSPYGSGGIAHPHAAGSVVIVSNTPQFYDKIIAYVNDIAVAGAPDASLTAKGLVEIAAAAEIDADEDVGATGAMLAMNPAQVALSKYGLNTPSAAEKAGLDAAITTPSAANPFLTLADDALISVIYGETIAVNDLLYIKSTDQKCYKASCAVFGEPVLNIIGYATAAGVNNSARYVRRGGRMTGFTGLVAGRPVYVPNATPGPVTQSESTYPYLRTAGFAISTTEIIVFLEAGAFTTIVSDTLRHSNDTARDVSSSTAKIKQILINTFLPAVRVKYNYLVTGGGSSTFQETQVYKNGSTLGSLNSGTNSNNPWSQDFTNLKPGDLLQIYGRSDFSGTTRRVSNFRLYWDHSFVAPPVYSEPVDNL